MAQSAWLPAKLRPSVQGITIMTTSSNANRFTIFRGADAPTLDEAGSLTLAGVTPVIEKGIQDFVAAGGLEGAVVKELFTMPGFTLTYAWFKSGFPLPLHTHDVDCLYCVIAGSLRIGNETLGKGDGFFVPPQTPYSYTPGPEGVELLEFRHASHFDIRYKAGTTAYWEKITARVIENHPRWQREEAPL